MSLLFMRGGKSERISFTPVYHLKNFNSLSFRFLGYTFMIKKYTCISDSALSLIEIAGL